MAAREWAWPLAFAILAAVAVTFWPSPSEGCVDCIERPFGDNGTMMIRQEAGPVGTAIGCEGTCTVRWVTSHVGLIDAPRPPVSNASWFQVQFYAFEEGGELVASNSDPSGYKLYGDYVDVKQNNWTAAELQGAFTDYGLRIPLAPAGSTVSFIVPEHEYDWLVGPLYVTARVDATG